ncbi:MAG: hypothetical protein ISS52_00765 [Dehalococcoidia bacterium]|nr:hypothetical protein [Dehalococcoidia bacterium]
MNRSELKFAKKAIDEACKSESEDEQNPKVGAILVKDGTVVDTSHRGETGKGHHAEFALLQKKVRSIDLSKGATLYTTLEPCTARQHEKLPCVEWIVRKQIRRVVIGLLDPNPNICGRGYWRLLDANIEVEFFPSELVKRIVKMNKSFIDLHRGGEQYDVSFARLVERHKSSLVTPYPGIGWGDALCLQVCPNLREGWPMVHVELHHNDGIWYRLPKAFAGPYEDYFHEHYEEKRFYDDGEKFMLVRNPTAFSDSPTLKLYTRRCRYSEVQYYLENVSTIAGRREPLIEELIKGSLQVHFPHAVCMHTVVVTSDSKVLITRRSPKVAWHPNLWSCSIEEQLARRDLTAGPNVTIQEWGKRMLFEELGLGSDAYKVDDLKVLSVFLESDVLNISLCAYAGLRLTSAELDSILGGLPRTDYEFNEWAFLEFTPMELLSEMIRPSRLYHPTSGYRMLMAILHHFGMEELKRVLPQV